MSVPYLLQPSENILCYRILLNKLRPKLGRYNPLNISYNVTDLERLDVQEYKYEVMKQYLTG